jgi:hypothetical protein
MRFELPVKLFCSGKPLVPEFSFYALSRVDLFLVIKKSIAHHRHLLPGPFPQLK